MDKYDVEVVAAADGEVIDAVDGNYDRCHAEGRAVSCDGHPMRANIVSVRHADGIVSRYVHLKKGSVKVAVSPASAVAPEIADAVTPALSSSVFFGI